jgi:hypothetical protein
VTDGRGAPVRASTVRPVAVDDVGVVVTRDVVEAAGVGETGAELHAEKMAATRIVATGIKQT